MHINDIFAHQRLTLSFEFFPPKDDEASEQLYRSIAELEPLRPSFVSVTYGAGGSTRERTHELVVRLKEQTTLDPIPHLTCVNHDETQIQSILERFAAHGISNIMALAGDPPKGIEDPALARASFPHAADLVRFIKRFNDEGIHPDPRGFGIGVAGFAEGHPSTPNRLVEMDHLKAKVDEGADYIVTQMFFDNRDFYDFRERCDIAGITVPVLAGIMPITSSKGLYRMAELALGARFPARLLKALSRTDGDEKFVRKVGVQWAAEQCRDLLDNNARGIHLYTLNRSTATREIYASLGVKDSVRLTGA